MLGSQIDNQVAFTLIVVRLFEFNDVVFDESHRPMT
jgi:hypothetical protein